MAEGAHDCTRCRRTDQCLGAVVAPAATVALFGWLPSWALIALMLAAAPFGWWLYGKAS